MKRSASLLTAALLAATAAVIPAVAAAEVPVVGQELVKVRASNQVQAASWTRRPDSYTLQLVLSPAAFSPAANVRVLKLVDGRQKVASSAAAAAEAQPPKQTGTSLWLLRADGTQILSRMPVTKPAPDKCSLRCNGIEVLYRFSIAEASQAVAAAVRVGDDFYIEKLESLEQVQK